MEALLGFVVGYYFGSKSGRDDLAAARKSLKSIVGSGEVQMLTETGMAIMGEVLKQRIKVFR